MQEKEFGRKCLELNETFWKKYNEDYRVIIDLTPEEVTAAREHSDKILQVVDNYGQNYIGGNFTRNRFFVGRCGELAVLKWARKNGLKCEDTTGHVGVKDVQDHLWTTSSGEVIASNVKNSHNSRATRLLVSVAESERYHYQYYIGATGRVINDSWARIMLWGAIEHDDWVKRRQLTHIYNDVWEVPLRSLPLKMHQFAEIVK
jgi:hypothetical protein